MKFHVWAQRADAFIHEVALEIGKDRAAAYHVTRAALHTLRDRLTTGEAKDLMAQLPMFIKAVWVDGWDPTLGPDKSVRHREDLIDRVMADPAICPGRDLDRAECERCVAGVFRVLRRHISLGEADDVRAQLPKGLRPLWP